MSPEKPWSTTQADVAWDDIVIGSGMGGMTAAAMLSKLGRRVLVLEQHYVPGGFTHTFRRKHWVWDVGVHAVGEVTEHSLPGRLLAHLTDGRLKWASLGPVYDAFYYPDDFQIDFPDTPDQFRDNLLSAFPRERAGIDTYLREVRDVSSAMRGFYMARVAPRAVDPILDRLIARRAKKHFGRTTKEVIDRLTPDERLRTVLVAQWGYHGAVPSQSSFAIQALVAKHFMYGGYYPVGGSQAIAKELLTTVKNAGGWTRIRADVASIVLEEGRACGVRLENGEVLRSRRVVSAAGVRATVERMLPRELGQEAWSAGIRTLRPGPAHVCLYLGFEGDIRAAGAGSANQWFWTTYDTEAEAWPVGPDGELPDAPVLYTSFPSLKDPAHDPGPHQRHTGEVVTFVPWSVFEPWLGSRWRHRGPEYEAFKEKMKESLLKQLFRHRPGLKPLVKWAELSTPLSTDRFCRPVAGSIYGLAPTPTRYRDPWLRPRSPIPGLFFAGSEVATVGVIGAMMGGVLATLAAEPLDGFRLLQAINVR